MKYFVLFDLMDGVSSKVFDIEANSEEEAIDAAWDLAEEDFDGDRWELMGSEARIVEPVLNEDGRVQLGLWIMDRHNKPDEQRLDAWFTEAEDHCGPEGALVELLASESVSGHPETFNLPRSFFTGAQP